MLCASWDVMVKSVKISMILFSLRIILKSRFNQKGSGLRRFKIFFLSCDSTFEVSEILLFLLWKITETGIETDNGIF